MSKQKSRRVLPDISAWRAERLRVTAFPINAKYEISEATLWHSLVGKQPRRREMHDREEVLFEEGPLDNNALILALRKDRIDWVFVEDPEIDKGNEFPALGDLPSALELFLPLINKWLRNAPGLGRLAFGANLIQEVPNAVKAKSLIRNYVKTVNFTGTVEDFAFRNNRIKNSKSGVTGLKVNRMATWAVNRQNRVMYSESPTARVINERLVCRLELDINNVPLKNNKRLPKTHMLGVFAELVELGKEIAQRGDV